MLNDCVSKMTDTKYMKAILLPLSFFDGYCVSNNKWQIHVSDQFSGLEKTWILACTLEKQLSNFAYCRQLFACQSFFKIIICDPPRDFRE